MFDTMTAPEDVRIPSHGEERAAYLYRPEPPRGDVPCVVMAHGFSAPATTGYPPTPRHSATPGSPSSCSTTATLAHRQANHASCSTSDARTTTTVRSWPGPAGR